MFASPALPLDIALEGVTTAILSRPPFSLSPKQDMAAGSPETCFTPLVQGRGTIANTEGSVITHPVYSTNSMHSKDKK